MAQNFGDPYMLKYSNNPVLTNFGISSQVLQGYEANTSLGNIKCGIAILPEWTPGNYKGFLKMIFLPSTSIWHSV